MAEVLRNEKQRAPVRGKEKQRGLPNALPNRVAAGARKITRKASGDSVNHRWPLAEDAPQGRSPTQTHNPGAQP